MTRVARFRSAVFPRIRKADLPALLALGGAVTVLALVFFTRPALAPENSADGLVSVEAPALPGPAARRPPEPRSIAALHLFGSARPEEPKPVTEQLPETRLELRLVGVFRQDDGTGVAIIATGPGRQGHYRTGQRISGDVRLHQVEAGRVILERDGSYEALSIPWPRLGLDTRREAGEPAP